MPFFDATLAAIAAGRRVHVAMLADMDFADGMVRLWDGVGEIVVTGNTYYGTGALVSLSEVEFGANDSADKLTLTLSGVDTGILTAAQSSANVRGRDISLWGQFLSETTLAPLDAKWLIRRMIMDTLSYGASGPSDRTISLTCETIWTNRNHASYGFYTERDQNARFPGDRGLDFVPTLKTKQLNWPVYPGD